MGVWHQDRLADWPSFVTWIWLSLFSLLWLLTCWRASKPKNLMPICQPDIASILVQLSGLRTLSFLPDPIAILTKRLSTYRFIHSFSLSERQLSVPLFSQARLKLRFPNLSLRKLAKAIMLRDCILEVTSSNLNWDTDYPKNWRMPTSGMWRCVDIA
jgi:hypothetical protein